MQLEKVKNSLANVNYDNMLTAFTSCLERTGMDKKKQMSYATDMVTCLQKNTKLLTCSPESLLGGFLTAAQIGLSLNPATQLCYLIPYGKDAQFQLGYRGMVAIAKRQIPSLELYFECVLEVQGETAEILQNGEIAHKKSLKRSIYNNPLVGVYVYALIDGKKRPTFYLAKDDIDKIRQKNNFQKGSPTGAWATDYVAMAYAKVAKQYLSRSLMVEGIEQIDETVQSYNDVKNEVQGKSVYDKEYLIAKYKEDVGKMDYNSLVEFKQRLEIEQPELLEEVRADIFTRYKFLQNAANKVS